MSGWYSVAQAAKELGVTRQTVWNWIEKGEVPAFRATESSPFRISVVSINVLKQRLGLLPAAAESPAIVPQDLTRAEDFYAAEIAPVLAELRASSPEEVLQRMAVDPDFPLEHVKFPSYYLAYVQKLVSRAEGAIPNAP